MRKREELIKQIKDFVGKNKTGKAIKLLASEQLSDIDKELILLNSRYSKLTEERRLGIIDEELAQIQLNKINFNILALTDIIGAQEASPEEITPIKNNITSEEKTNKKELSIPKKDHIRTKAEPIKSKTTKYVFSSD